MSGRNRLAYLMAVLDSEFDYYAAPRFIKDLYRAIQMVTAVQCACFMAFLIAFRYWIGPTLLFVGFAMAPVVWFIVNLGVRMTLEFFMAVMSIRENIAEIRYIAQNANQHLNGRNTTTGKEDPR
ncbi:DUF4282 domain-containing protein [Actinomadura craniellae]|nr:DUF4282 domain-containing protein [Actinomadura craniellae]